MSLTCNTAFNSRNIINCQKSSLWGSQAVNWLTVNLKVSDKTWIKPRHSLTDFLSCEDQILSNNGFNNLTTIWNHHYTVSWQLYPLLIKQTLTSIHTLQLRSVVHRPTQQMEVWQLFSRATQKFLEMGWNFSQNHQPSRTMFFFIWRFGG